MNKNIQYSENFMRKMWTPQCYRALKICLYYWTIRVTYCIANGLPLNLLLGILLLLQFENVFIEVELEIFIGIVYTKLLKAVFL
jgi:hypothetical protein